MVLVLFFLSFYCQPPKFLTSVVRKKIEHVALLCWDQGKCEVSWKICRHVILTPVAVPNEVSCLCRKDQDFGCREGTRALNGWMDYEGGQAGWVSEWVGR